MSKAERQRHHASRAHRLVSEALNSLNQIDVDFLLEDATKDSIRRLVEVKGDTRELAAYARERLEEEGGGSPVSEERGDHGCMKKPAGWKITYAPPGTPRPKARLEKIHAPSRSWASSPVATISYCPWCGTRLP